MKILAIANSFSMDACAFLHQTAKAQGIDLDVTNLYIPGCPLEKHWLNVLSGEKACELQHNGERTEKIVSIQDMLDRGGWDVIVIQQASGFSGWMESYEPFLSNLLEMFHCEAPKARLLLQETWAYDPDCTLCHFHRYHCSQKEMYERLRSCYYSMSYKHGVDLIPCGDVIQHVRTLEPFCIETGGRSLCRDGYHMSWSYGRYLLALVWLKKLCSVSVKDNPFVPDGEEEVTGELLKILREAVDAWIM